MSLEKLPPELLINILSNIYPSKLETLVTANKYLSDLVKEGFEYIFK